MPYRRYFSVKETPQSEAIPGKDMVENSAGGFSFKVDDWKRLERFLILGSQAGTYYISERKLTIENADAVKNCAQKDGKRTVSKIVEISDAGRAPKNDPALFALAICAAFGDKDTRRYALHVLPKVARIGTHLFHFAAYVSGMRGWGRGLREAVASWYNNKSVEDVAFQAVKYQQRDGWSHRDLLRLSHPKTDEKVRNLVYKWIVDDDVPENGVPEIINGFELSKTAENVGDIVRLIRHYNLPREAVPTQWLNNKEVWEEMLPKMPMTALIRNLGNLSKVGVLVNGAWDVIKLVTGKITDEKALKKARVHPISLLAALTVYRAGRGFRGSGEWPVVTKVVDALDTAFYLAFKNVEPSNKRFLLGLDVSGSMVGNIVNGMPFLDARTASAAMAMVTNATENNVICTAFSNSGSRWDRSGEGIIPFELSRKERLDNVCSRMYDMPFAGTDCALPMLYAMKNKLEVDTFVVYTDSETWHGSIHPCQALVKYRKQTGIPARLVVVGMCSNQFTIADPNDSGMLDVAGFDTTAPAVISDFAAGKV